MKAVLAGVAVLVVAAGAFALGGYVIEEESAGPAEEIGAAVDEAASDIERGVEDAAD